MERDKAEVKYFLLRLGVMMVVFWLLFGVVFGVTAMKDNSMSPKLEAGDLVQGEHCLRIPDLAVGNAEHIGIAGVNGSGKTTLLTALMRRAPDDLSTLFIPQEIGSELAARIMASLHEASPGERGRVLSIVAQLNSDPDRILDGDELSPGELRKLMLAQGILCHPVLIAMDEPTNHLDMRSKDVLKDALKEFDGTVIVVSHDREFLDGLVDKVYEFGNKRVIEHLGGIYDFLEHKKMDSLCELERSTQTTTSMEGNAAEPTRNKLSYEARKEQSKAIKKVEKAIAESEKKITELENSIAAIEAKLATPEGAADVSLYTEYSELKKKLSDTMDLWTEQTLELEELNAANS